jgi:hypothetical protein
LVKALLFGTAMALAAIPAEACRLALVLAIDVSNSVDTEEDKLQRAGLANALLAPDVQDAFLISPNPVSLLVFEWSGRHHQKVLLEWQTIRGPEDLLSAADQIARSTRGQRDFPTAMGYALGYAATRLREKPECLAKTIDVAGDGVNNDGFGPTEAYNAFEFDNVTVNGLVVDASILETREQLLAFFEGEVIRGASSFVEVANGFEDYQETMRRKLIRELLAQMIGNAGPAAQPPKG